MAEADDVIVLLVAENDNRLQFVAAQGASVKTSIKQVATTVLPLINGKGGGNDAFVQGGGESLPIRGAVADLIEDSVTGTEINETSVKLNRK